MTYCVRKFIAYKNISYYCYHTLFIIFALIIFSHSTVDAATYYVNPSTGNDNNPGTSSSPWKTPAWANANAAAGSTVYLMSGKYGDVIFNQKITRTDWAQAINFEAASGATPIFSSLRFSSIGNAYISVKGALIEGVDAGTTTYDAGVDIYNSSYVKVINCKINGVWKSRIEDGITDIGVRIRYSTKPINYVTIDGCEITDVDVGISVSGQLEDGIVLRNNYIYHFAGTGIQLDPINADNGTIIIEKNHISGQYPIAEGTGNTHGSGISIRANNLLIKNNIIHGCGNTRGIRTYQSVFPDTGYQNLTFENNLVYDTINDLPVEFVDLGKNIVFRNNTIIGHYGTSSLPKYKYGSSVTFSVANQADGSAVSFHNNIFVGYISINPGFINYTENNNIIWAAVDNTSGSVWKRELKGSDTLILCADNYYYDLNIFELSGKFFAGGTLFETYSYSVSKDGGNNTPHRQDLNTAYKLASGSIAIGFGTSVNAPATDITGVSRGSVIDAGCYEFGTVPANTVQLSAIGNKTIAENSTLTFSISATSTSGSLLTYSAKNLPSGATFSGRTFTWKPNYNQAGSYNVTFVASDGTSQAEQTITITVTNTNQPPVLTSIGNKAVHAQAQLAFTLNASDPDGDLITYSASNLPSGAKLTGNAFSWTPTATQQGTYTVTFTASDGKLSNSQQAIITVTGVNNPPIIGYVADQTAIAGTLLSFSVPMSDPDDDSLLCAAMNLPAGAAFQNGVFGWTPATSQVGNYTVTFYANDGLATTTENVLIAVKSAPTITVIIDNASPNTASSGTWTESSAPAPYGGRSVWGYDGATYIWKFTPTVSGTYRISMWWTELSTRSDRVPVEISYNNGTATVYINQQQNGGLWNTLGQYAFTAGTTYKVTITAPEGSPPSTCADAVKFEKF